MERFINPYNDYGFKKLFGTKENKDLLISFLNALLEGIYLFCIVSTNPYTKRHKQNTCYNESQLTELFEAAWLANLNDAQELAYDQAQMAMWDEYAVLESAWREGYVQGLMLLVAKALIKKDFDLTTIMKITGLSEDEIQKLTN